MLKSLLCAAVALALAIPGAASAADEYRIGQGDVVGLHVYNEADLSTDLMVDDNCQVNVGLVGQVQICGLTTAQVGDTIRERLARKS